MQIVRPIRAGREEAIGAVNHFGTSRPQTLAKHHSPLCHALVERFGEAAGVPMLLNTSFNLRGEPIVASPEDALSTYQRSGIDLLVMDRILVERRE
jgi:carbamoyltransferase